MKKDYVTPTVAVLVLLAMLGFTFTADRDDKAWKMVTDWVGVGAEKPKLPAKKP